MAAEVVVVVPVSEAKEEDTKTTHETINKEHSLSTYLGLSFAIFLGLLPKSSISLVSSLQSRNRALSFKLIQAEEQLKQMKSRRKEDSKANARVVEIFASHRNGWQQEERKLLQQIEGSAEEIAHLRDKIDELEKTEGELRVCLEKLQREVEEREEMINFMSRQGDEEEENEEEEEGGVDDGEDYGVGSIEGGEMDKEEVGDGMYHSQIRGCYGRTYQEANGEFGDHCGGNFSRFGNIRVSDQGLDPISEECYMYRNGDEMPVPYGQHNNGFTQNYVSAAPTVCSEKAGGWQDARYDSVESMYHMKQFAARRESPWKVHGESTGVPSKLKLLEQELLNLERNDMGDQSKVPSSMRKQAKRYQSLAGKIDDLCKRMSSDPCEQNLSAEFRTRRQTEFLLEAYRLQQRAIETRQKLTTLQTETAKSHFGEDLSGHAKLTTKRSLDSVKNNFREIQRNLEVWLARIMGDLEGVLSRDGASRVKEYYISRNPFVQ